MTIVMLNSLQPLKQMLSTIFEEKSCGAIWKKWKSALKKCKNAVHCGEVCVHPKDLFYEPDREFFVYFDSKYCIEPVEAYYARDLYLYLSCLLGNDYPLSIFLKEKLIKNDYIPLYDYNVKNGDVFRIVFHPLLGGSDTNDPSAHKGEKDNLRRYLDLFNDKKNTYYFLRKHLGNTKRGLEIQSAEYAKIFIKKNEWYVKLVEDLLMLIYQFKKSSSWDECTMALLNFAKLRSTTSLSYTVFTVMFDDMFNFNVQAGGEFLSSARELLNNYEIARVSPMAQKLYLFVTKAIGASVLDHFNIPLKQDRLDIMAKGAMELKLWQRPDFIYTALDTILFICERGVQCYNMGSFQPILHGATAYDQWITDCETVKRWSLFINNPEPHGFNEFTFREKLDHCVEVGDAIIKQVKALGKWEASIVRKCYADVMLVRATHITRIASLKSRTSPLCTLVFGDSGMMKTMFTDMLDVHYGKLFKLPLDEGHRYTRNPYSDHWDGFATSMWSLHLDELGALLPAKVIGVDNSIKEILQINNEAHFNPPQAALEDKGKTPFRGRFVTATTNTPLINAEAYFCNAYAVMRRFPICIRIAAKQQYAKTESGQICIDPAKVPPLLPGEYPNLWNIHIFEVVEVKADNRQFAKMRPIGSYTDVYEFMAWYTDQCLNFAQKSAKVEADRATLHSMQLCDKCYRPESKCVCSVEVVQSRELCRVLLTDNEEHSSIIQFPRSNFEFRIPKSDIFVEDDQYFIDIDKFCRDRGLVETIIEGKTPMSYRCRINDELHHIPDDEVLKIGDKYYAQWKPLPQKLENIDPEITEMAREIVDRSIPRCSLFCSIFLRLASCFLYAYAKLSIVRQIAMYMFTYGWIRGFVSWMVVSLAPGIMPAFMKVLGDIVSHKFSAGQKASIIIAGVASMLTLWKVIAFLRKSDEEDDEDIISICSDDTDLSLNVGINRPSMGKKPIARQIEPTNVWKNEDIVTSDHIVPSFLNSFKGCERSKIIDALKNNMFHIHADHGNDIWKNCRMIGIKGHIFATCNHSLPTQGDFKLKIIRGPTGPGVTSNIMVRVSQSDIYRPGKDMAFIDLRCLPPVRDITKYFATEEIPSDACLNGFSLGRNREGNIVHQDVREVHWINLVNETLPDIHFYLKGSVNKDSIVGDCGNLCVLETAKGPVICGWHLLGGKRLEVCFKPLSQLDFADLDLSKQVEPSSIPISAPGYERKLTDLHNKSSVRFLESGSADIFGSFTGFRPQNKTNVKETCVSAELQSQGIELKFAKPDMSWKPWHHAIKEMTDINMMMSPDILKSCASDYLSKVMPVAEKFAWMLAPLDDDTNLNGADGVAYIDKIKRKTSMGVPWRKKKERFIEEIDGKECFTKEIMDRIKLCEDNYLNGKRNNLVFCANLKDEPVSQRKAKIGKTRVFAGAPVELVFLARKYFLPIVRLIQTNKIDFEMAVSCVAQSSEWGEMRAYLVANGLDRLVAGDYKSYDKRMGAIVILLAFEILIEIAKLGDYSEADITIMRGIAEDIAFPIMDFNGDLIQFLGSNPSGHPLTVIINSIVNSLYLRYAWHVEFGNLLEFKNSVRPLTYGDDNALSVAPGVDRYNHTTIQKHLGDVGIEYTMADKESESVPFIHIDDVSFLKRKWLYDKDVGDYLAPLEMDSIYRSLMIGIPSKVFSSSEAYVAEVMHSAIREWWHYGRETFDEKRKWLYDLSEKCNIPVGELPTWENCASSWLKSSRRTYLVRLQAFDNCVKWVEKNHPTFRENKSIIAELLADDQSNSSVCVAA